MGLSSLNTFGLLLSGVKTQARAVLVARCWSWWWLLPMFAATPSPLLFLFLNVFSPSIIVGRGLRAAHQASGCSLEGPREEEKETRGSAKEGATPASVLVPRSCWRTRRRPNRRIHLSDKRERIVDMWAEEFISALRHGLRSES